MLNNKSRLYLIIFLIILYIAHICCIIDLTGTAPLLGWWILPHHSMLVSKLSFRKLHRKLHMWSLLCCVLCAHRIVLPVPPSIDYYFRLHQQSPYYRRLRGSILLMWWEKKSFHWKIPKYSPRRTNAWCSNMTMYLSCASTKI